MIAHLWLRRSLFSIMETQISSPLFFGTRRSKELKPDKLASDGFSQSFILFNSLYTFWAVLFFTSFSSFEFPSRFSISCDFFSPPCPLFLRCLTDVQTHNTIVPGKLEKSLKFSTNFHIFHLTTINYHLNLMKFFFSRLHLRSVAFIHFSL